MTATTAIETVPGYLAGTWAIDPVHTDVGFVVRHMVVAKVRGRFTKFEGQIVTGENPADSSVTATIDLTSIDTGNQQRDDHIRSADFFEVETYPTMTYRSTGVRQDGNDLILDGQLTLKGVTKDVPLRLELNGFGPDALRRHPRRLHRDRGHQPPRLRRQLQRRARDRRSCRC